MLKGSMVAIVTPMNEDGTINFAEYEKLIHWHVEQGTQAIIILGTTGESATVTMEERTRLIQQAVKCTSGRCSLIVGTGTNATRTSIELTKQAETLGADACLIVTPYYTKPTQEGLKLHYAAIANATSIPVFIYNVPGRTACDIKVETVAELARLNNVIGIKDATGDLSRVRKLRELCGPAFILLSGDDETACDFMLQGGDGVISVTANVAPTLMRKLCDAARHKNEEQARKYDHILAELHKNLFIEANPIPVKWALHQMGKIPSGIRLPLTQLSVQYRQPIKDMLQKAGLLA